MFFLWLVAIICACETIKIENNVIEYKCPRSLTPITFEKFAGESDKFGKPDDNLKYWSSCLPSDYSCAKIRIIKDRYIFSCISDYGIIRPVEFTKDNATNVHSVTYYNTFSLTKGCKDVVNEAKTVANTSTTVFFANSTFVTELYCCKGTDCSGDHWKDVWNDKEYDPIKFINHRHRGYFYWVCVLSGSIPSGLVLRLSLMGYWKWKEVAIIASLKRLSASVAEADEEDKVTRGSVLKRMLGKCRRRRKKAVSSSKTSVETNSMEALIKDRQRKAGS
ncbi:unnamed protein product [Caenorhabditis sp. 36 PRJEB53466]|nr:unnamed protein product [Caenorhabditis sp. 36 PRJEB53466]